MTIGIYCIQNIVDGKRYIGKSVDIEKRWTVHKSRPDNRYLRNAINKHGISNFKFEILEQFADVSEDVLANCELKWMDHYTSWNRRFGYNLKRDSASNSIMADESKLLISEKLKGRPKSAETRARMSASMKGRPKSREHVEKLKGKKRSDAARARMSVSAMLRESISEETRAKIAHNSKNISDATRAKLSASRIGRPLAPQHRENVARANRNITPERRAKLIAGCRKRSASPDYRAKLSAANKRRAFRKQLENPLILWSLIG